MMTVDNDDVYEMDMIRRALEDGRPVEVRVFILEQMEHRLITIQNLRYGQNGWGEKTIEGMVVDNGHLAPVILHDNPADANPLNLSK